MRLVHQAVEDMGVKGRSREPAGALRFVCRQGSGRYVYVDLDQALQNAIRDDWAKLGQQQQLRSVGPPRGNRATVASKKSTIRKE